MLNKTVDLKNWIKTTQEESQFIEQFRFMTTDIHMLVPLVVGQTCEYL